MSNIASVLLFLLLVHFTESFSFGTFKWSTKKATTSWYGGRGASRIAFGTPIDYTGTMQSSRMSTEATPHSRPSLHESMINLETLMSDEEDSTAPLTSEAPEISSAKEGIKFEKDVNGSDVRVGIIMARWNADVIDGLYKGVNQSLAELGVKPSNVFTTYVPGAFELPVTAKFLGMSKRVDVIVCLGCLIKGDTMHFEYIADATAHGLMKVSIDTLVPTLFGVLTVLDKEQAIVRSTGDSNEGLSWGKSAVEMGLNRMSALGMGKSLTKSNADTVKTDFVSFKNGTLPETEKPENDTNESGNKKERKKIGF